MVIVARKMGHEIFFSWEIEAGLYQEYINSEETLVVLQIPIVDERIRSVVTNKESNHPTNITSQFYAGAAQAISQCTVQHTLYSIDLCSQWQIRVPL